MIHSKLYIRHQNLVHVVIYTIIYVFTLFHPVYGRGIGRIKGHVVDSQTGQSLANASLQLIQLKKGTTSDQKGYFRFDHLVFTADTLLVTYMGYNPIKIPLVIQGYEPVKVDVKLEPRILPMPEVNVVGDKFASHRNIMIIEPNARSLSYKELSLTPSLAVPDVFQSLQTLPGITTSSPATTQLSIRGGDVDQNLVLLDGAVLYYPYHSLNVASNFIMDTIERVDVLMGGFTPRYGDRLSSVIHVHTRRPQKRVEAHANVSWIGNDGVIGARLGSKISVMLAGRKNFNRALNGFFDQHYAFNFYDLFAKLTFQPFNNQSLEVMYFKNRDGQDWNESTAYVWPHDGNKIPYDFIGKREIAYVNELYAGNYAIQLGRNLVANAHLSSSTLDNYFDVYYQIGLDEKYVNLYPSVNAELQHIAHDRNQGEATWINNSLEDHTARLEFEWSPSERCQFNGGGQFTQIQFDYGWDRYNNLWDPYIYVFFDHAPKYDYSYINKVKEKAFYLENTWKITPWLDLKPGVRWTKWDFLLSVIEPRFAARVKITEQYQLKSSVGRFSQGIATSLERGLVGFLPLYFPIQKGNKPALADHYILSLEKQSHQGINYSMSGYIKNFDHLLKSDTHDSLFSSSTGKAWGVELTADARFGKLATQMSYVYSKSWRNYDGIDYDTKADKRHQIQSMATYHITPKLTLTATWQFSSGQPYSPGRYQFLTRNQSISFFRPDGDYDYSWLAWYDDRPISSIRYPWFHKLDINVSYQKRYKGIDFSPYVSIYNIYNRKNVLYYNEFGYDVYTRDDGLYDIDVGRRGVTLPLIATAGLKVRF